MATVREGRQGVLLIVDVQLGVLQDAWDAERVVGRVALALGKARAQGLPVVWVRHADDELPHGSAAWQWVPELAPGADETVIEKRFNSAFEQTTLDEQLARLAATHIVLAGAATNWCIRATAYAALERGYDLTLVADAHTTASLVLTGGSRVEAQSMVDELNTAMRWLSYPGRSNCAVPVGDLDLAAAVGLGGGGP
jgi:nicotinamidase-related amidase